MFRLLTSYLVERSLSRAAIAFLLASAGCDAPPDAEPPTADIVLTPVAATTPAELNGFVVTGLWFGGISDRLGTAGRTWKLYQRRHTLLGNGGTDQAGGYQPFALSGSYDVDVGGTGFQLTENYADGGRISLSLNLSANGRSLEGTFNSATVSMQLQCEDYTLGGRTCKMAQNAANTEWTFIGIGATGAIADRRAEGQEARHASLYPFLNCTRSVARRYAVKSNVVATEFDAVCVGRSQ